MNQNITTAELEGFEKGFAADPADAPPLALAAVLVALPAVVILGVLLALFQRIKEIRKGEEDDAKNY